MLDNVCTARSITHHADQSHTHTHTPTQDFLAGGGSIITTSHDSEFLEEMCTHVVDFQKKKLVTMKGNLKDFVAMYPEKKVSSVERVVRGVGLTDGLQ